MFKLSMIGVLQFLYILENSSKSVNEVLIFFAKYGLVSISLPKYILSASLSSYLLSAFRLSSAAESADSAPVS